MVMCFHFVNQYGNSRAVPNMLLDLSHGGLSPKGTFWFFAVITVLGGIWAWLFIPETANVSLEAMDALFKEKWYKIGLKGKEAALVAEQQALERRLEEKGGAVYIEHAPPKTESA